MKNSLRLAVLAGAVTAALGFAVAPADAAPTPSAVLAAGHGSDHHHSRGAGAVKNPDDPNRTVTNDRHTSHDTNVRNSHDTNWNLIDDRHTSHDTNVRNDGSTSHDVNTTNDRHISHDTNFNTNRSTSHDVNYNTNYNVTYDYGTHVLPDVDDLPIVGSLLG